MTVRRYVPWVRRDLTGATTADSLTGAVPARGTLTLDATVNTADTTTMDIQVYGPGDVVGFDSRQAIRREPQPDAPDAEPNYFPIVELDRPDLPWLFSTLAPNADRLRPWIVLIAVRRDQVTIEAASGRLPVLHIADARQELPNLDESWAWAHAQVANMADLADDASTRTLSRVVCPRLLAARTRYLAAIVPAFELGRCAGLGLPVDDTAVTTAPAWTSTTEALDLPMYLWWEFVTGQEGDFQSLVTRLKRNNAAAAAGQPFDVSHLVAGLPDLGTWMLPGALGVCPDPYPARAFTDRLCDLVNGRPVTDLVLPPPFYGRWHAGVPGLPAGPPGQTWIERINLDPRYRAAAAIGARIVQAHQEDLMAAAWRQVGEIEAANALLRQGQLARRAGTVHHGAIAALAPEVLLQVSGQMHTRVLSGTLTIAATVEQSRVPSAMVSGTFRRALRPRGRLARRFNSGGTQLITGVNAGRLRLVRPAPRPDGLVAIDDAAGRAARFCSLTESRLGALRNARRGNASDPQWRAFIAAASAHQRGMPGCEPQQTALRPALDLAALRTALLAATDPAQTVPRRLRARLTLPAGWYPVDPLEPVWAAPRFDTPVFRDLLAISQDYVVPGIQDVPPNSVTAMQTNPRFVEALLVGMNHEMSRELIWRGFPTDQRGTYFRRFWDRAGSIAGSADDIPAIDQWQGDLGTHVVGGEQVVLVVRGEVLHRYPRTSVYAARAQWDSNRRMPVPPAPGSDPTAADYPERYPIFSGTIPSDVTLFGFALDPVAARGHVDPAQNDPGWFFVFQQQPTEPRLGLDLDADPAGTTVSWPVVSKSASDHISLAGGLTGATVFDWSTNSTSAAIGALVEQQPFRICVHASDLLPLAP
jgi:hypothetical protein